jgi:hypothetical protein
VTNNRVGLAACGAIATLTFAAACSGEAATTTPTAAPPASTAATLPNSSAPKVEHPLPDSVLSGDPCQTALTPDQLKQILGIAPQGERDDAQGLGPACNWHNSDTGAVVGVGYTTEQRDGLSAVYAGTKPQAKVWQELPLIQGFPAVAHSTSGADTPDNFCQVSVGISDELEFDASLILSSAKTGTADPCTLTAKVADMVVTNLRKKAGQ